MKNRNSILICLFAMMVAAGCAKTTITNRQQLVAGKLPRPAHIWVSSFAASAADIPSESALTSQYTVGAANQTQEQLEMGQKLGAQIATELVNQINAMGMSAYFAKKGMIIPFNDIVIRGYLVSFDEGDAAKRVAIGFGSGASNLEAVAEGFQMTAQGLRKLGSGTSDASGSKGPGTAVGLVTFLATRNPAGLIISGGMKVYGEASGKSKIEGRADQTAKEIAEILKKRFQEEGWIK